jgi:hypothetical protein
LGPFRQGSLGIAAAVCLGRSPWLRSFNPHHLVICQHYRNMFYDEFLDMICERVKSKKRGYVNA